MGGIEMRQALSEENVIKFFRNRGGTVAKALILDTEGLDTPSAQALIVDMVQRGLLVDRGNTLDLVRDADGRARYCSRGAGYGQQAEG